MSCPYRGLHNGLLAVTVFLVELGSEADFRVQQPLFPQASCQRGGGVFHGLGALQHGEGRLKAPQIVVQASAAGRHGQEGPQSFRRLRRQTDPFRPGQNQQFLRR